MKKVSAGDVLTVALLNKVDKSQFQYGGLVVYGDIMKKSAVNLDAKTTVLIDKKHVKCDLNKFHDEFLKTMNSWYYNIKFI